MTDETDIAGKASVEVAADKGVAANLMHEPVSIGTWVGVWALGLLNLIPLIGFILYMAALAFIAFGGKVNLSLQNWAKAMLIISAVVILLLILLLCGVFSLGVFESMINQVFYEIDY
ncbi:MAG: hypothetical protein FWG78_01730 [Coriobacteriia bacterium]|nr:hypothetical protein [Coriobacteriia bacterium]